MQTQFDWQKRIVSLDNLKAMCDHVSGMCHKFEVIKVSRSRVHVEYSNPDEYGNEHPMVAIFPCYPDCQNIAIVLDIMRVVYDDWEGEGWQAFTTLLDCPKMWWNPFTQEWNVDTLDEHNRKES